MKARYLVLTTMAFILFLTGCKNRFEEFEPYSAFDDRMALAESGGPMPTDDQMPPPDFGDQYAGGVDRGYYNDAGSSSYERPPRMAVKQYSNNSGSNGEVPFSDSRGPKHATNIGALQ